MGFFVEFARHAGEDGGVREVDGAAGDFPQVGHAVGRGAAEEEDTRGLGLGLGWGEGGRGRVN